MSTAVEQVPVSDDASAGSLPLRKRKPEDDREQSSRKMLKTEDANKGFRPVKRGPISKAREIRLEQNRKAARESRRRKKVMIEELQRSVIFFSRANGTLKQQNDELTRLHMQAQAQVAIIENQQNGIGQQEQQPVKNEGEQAAQQQRSFQQAQANAVATQAMYETQGYPPAAARAAAQTMSGSSHGESQQAQNSPAVAPAPGSGPLPPMQPGATMQAMANFQQAAAAAMQAAVQGMQSIPGLSLQALATAPAGANAQQAYNDTMTALAMQHAAAAAAAGHQFFQGNPFMAPGAHHMMAWQQQQQQQANQAQAAPATTEQGS